jgi:hypothetical protein
MRDTEILKLRPELRFEVRPDTEIERFQNDTLRPILKLQNDLLLAIFESYISDKRPNFKNFAPADKTKAIGEVFKKDQQIKQLTEGIVVGHFTITEFDFYKNNQSEASRRISNMIIERIKSQVV